MPGSRGLWGCTGLVGGGEAGSHRPLGEGSRRDAEVSWVGGRAGSWGPWVVVGEEWDRRCQVALRGWAGVTRFPWAGGRDWRDAGGSARFGQGKDAGVP